MNISVVHVSTIQAKSKEYLVNIYTYRACRGSLVR